MGVTVVGVHASRAFRPDEDASSGRRLDRHWQHRPSAKTGYRQLFSCRDAQVIGRGFEGGAEGGCELLARAGLY